MPLRKIPSKKQLQGYTWQLYFYYKDEYGVTTRYSKSGFKTKKEALDHEVEKKNEIAVTGRLQREFKKTFNQVFEEYMDVIGKAKYASATRRYYLYTYEHYIKNSIGRKQIFSMHYNELQKYFNTKAKSLSTAKNIKKIFNVTFKYAMRCRYIASDPMLLVNLNIEEKKSDKTKVITESELEVIISEIHLIGRTAPDIDASIFANQSYEMALRIGWYTGLRLSEVLGLHRTDFDLENNLIHVKRRLDYHGYTKKEMRTVERMKTKESSAIIPMTTKLQEIMTAWLKTNPYEVVICDIEGDYICPGTLTTKLNTISKKTGIYFHFHMLRHSFATNLVKAGILPNITKDLMRHSDITTTLSLYTHITKEDKMNAINQVFGGKSNE
ncbi:MAG: tyrosine-type recombinase/integrase [Longicatena sp.]|uniref:site-specific integrase n=1 Tax=Anaerorhabdus sp. TaxID=1872524 RepID=UPI002FC5CB1F